MLFPSNFKFHKTLAGFFFSRLDVGDFKRLSTKLLNIQQASPGLPYYWYRRPLMGRCENPFALILNRHFKHNIVKNKAKLTVVLYPEV